MVMSSQTGLREPKIAVDPEASTWAGSVIAGFVGGIAFIAYLTLASWLGGRGFWRPLELIGGVVPAFRPVGHGFQLGPVLVGLIVHMGLSGALGLMYGAVVRGFPKAARAAGGEFFMGLAFGLIVWMVAGLWLGPMIDPPIRFVPPGHWFFAHALYGVVAGETMYALLRNQDIAAMRRPRADEVTRAEGPRGPPEIRPFG